jgi:hypothetical protein
MSTTNPIKRYGHRASREAPVGPRTTFLVAMAAIGFIAAAGIIPASLLMPTISLLLFVLAAVFALVAWVRCSTDEYDVSYWDVAGAVAFIGICTAALVEPDQLVRIVAGSHRDE